MLKRTKISTEFRYVPVRAHAACCQQKPKQLTDTRKAMLLIVKAQLFFSSPVTKTAKSNTVQLFCFTANLSPFKEDVGHMEGGKPKKVL